MDINGGAMTEEVKCNPYKESRQSPVPHDYEVVDTEYGSLAEGGSYDKLRCKNCGRIAWSPIAD